MLLKVNYFAADKRKSLACRVFIKAEMILSCVYPEFHVIYFEMFFTQFFNTTLFNKSLLIQDTNLILFCKIKRKKRYRLSPFKSIWGEKFFCRSTLVGDI